MYIVLSLLEVINLIFWCYLLMSKCIFVLYIIHRCNRTTIRIKTNIKRYTWTGRYLNTEILPEKFNSFSKSWIICRYTYKINHNFLFFLTCDAFQYLTILIKRGSN